MNVKHLNLPASLALACLLLSPSLSMASGLATAIKECNSGNVEKCESVADKYDEADGVKRDYKKAASFYKKACDLKSAFGCRLMRERVCHSFARFMQRCLGKIWFLRFDNI